MADKPVPKQWNQLSTKPVKLAAAAAKKLEEAQEAVQEEGAIPAWVPAGYNPKIPPVVPLESLSKEKQDQVMKQLRALQEEAQAAVAPNPTAQIPPAATAAELNPAAALPDPPKPVEPEPAKPKAEPRHFCKNCGFDSQQDPVAATDQDKRDFVRALFGGKVFEKEYLLFQLPDGAKYTVTFRTRTTDVEDAIALQLRHEVTDKRILLLDPTVAASNYSYRMRRLQMAASLARVSPGLETTLPEMDTQEASVMWSVQPGDLYPNDLPVSRAEKRLYKKWAAPLYSAVWREFQFFEALVLRLTEGANRPDFWQGTAGQS